LDLQIEERFFRIPEFVRRLEDKPLTSKILLFEAGYDRELNLERILSVDKIKSYRLRDYDENDIRQTSKLKFFELLRKQRSSLRIKRRSPLVFPGEKEGLIKMLPPEKKFWQGPMARALESGREALLREFVPRFEGETELIPEKVRQDRRRGFRKTARQQKIFHGQERFRKEGADSWRAVWDFSEKAAAGRYAAIRSETTGQTLNLNPEEIVIEKETQREELRETIKSMTLAYEVAKQRSGKKGVVFIDQLKAGKTEIEAADKAQMSARTGRRILEAIRKAPTVKSTKKTSR
jgi:hypothetical protein